MYRESLSKILVLMLGDEWIIGNQPAMPLELPPGSHVMYRLALAGDDLSHHSVSSASDRSSSTSMVATLRAMILGISSPELRSCCQVFATCNIYGGSCLNKRLVLVDLSDR
jgi:hypothetical protein